MVLIKALLTGLVGVSLCMAAISGIVTDTGGTIPIPGAVVQLEKGGQTTTTGADGCFTLNASTAIPHGISPLLLNGLSARISGTVLNVTIAKRSAVEVAIFDLKGALLSTVRKTLDAGSLSLSLPYREAGIYLFKVKSGNSAFVIKSNSVNGVSSGNAAYSQGASSNNTFTKRAMGAAAINDVIAATKTGYLNYRVSVTNSDTNGIAIRMIASAGTVTDADGNVYQSVRIGNQVWTVENLRVTKYTDNTPVSLDTSATTWADAATPKYCYYNNTTNHDSIRKYGALYNWYVVSAANPKKIAPTGWHMPSDAEWDTLQNYLVAKGHNGNATTTGRTIAKSLASKTDWNTNTPVGTTGYDLTMNNSSGFSALPGGYRDDNGYFYQFFFGYWWSATESDDANAWYRYLYYDCDHLLYWSCGFNYQSFGLSVRLLRD